LENLETEKTSLSELWEQHKVTLDQSLELQLFYRDCQNADNQMAKQEVGECSRPIYTIDQNLLHDIA
jgi:spectrin alpha